MKERAHGIRIYFHFRGRGRHVTRSRFSAGRFWKSEARVAIYPNQYDRKILIWVYQYFVLEFRDTGWLLYSFTFLLFPFFLHYTTPTMPARGRTFAIHSRTCNRDILFYIAMFIVFIDNINNIKFYCVQFLLRITWEFWKFSIDFKLSILIYFSCIN